MKKTIAILLCLILLLCGCDMAEPADTGSTIPAVTPPPETTVPAVTTEPPATEPAVTEPPVTEPPAPETAPATALADGVVLLLQKADMGTELEIIGEEAEYYIVKLGDGHGLIEKRLVRMDGEEAYEPWTGYSYYGAGFYTNYLLLPDGMTEMKSNQQVEVLDSLGEVLMVRMGETVGYMNQKSLSRSYIPAAPSSGSNDGGDIELSGHSGASKLSFFLPTPQSDAVSGTGIVKTDGAEIVFGWFDRGETVALVTDSAQLPAQEGWCVVYLDGVWGYVRQNLIRRADAQAYSPWDGYAKYDAPLYSNYYLSGEAEKKLSTNTVVQVLEDLGHCYLVSVGDNQGYMAKDKVSETKNAVGGNSGGEWSDPVL